MATPSNDRALVNGATTRVGVIVAHRLARRGFELVLVARDGKQLALVADRIERETGRSVAALAADLGDETDLAALEAGLRNTTSITMLVDASPMDDEQGLVDVAPARRLAEAAAACFAGRGHGTVITMMAGSGTMSPEALVDEALAGLDGGGWLAIPGRAEASSAFGASALELFDAVA